MSRLVSRLWTRHSSHLLLSAVLRRRCCWARLQLIYAAPAPTAVDWLSLAQQQTRRPSRLLSNRSMDWRTDRQTDRQTDARPLHVPCSEYLYAVVSITRPRRRGWNATANFLPEMECHVACAHTKYARLERAIRHYRPLSVFSNRVINTWNSPPTQCVNCNTADTFEKYVSIALESETDVNSWLCLIVGVKWRKPVPTYAVIVWMNFGGFGGFGERQSYRSCVSVYLRTWAITKWPLALIFGTLA